MAKAKRIQSRPLPRPITDQTTGEQAAEPIDDWQPQKWLAEQLERVQALLAIPYPATSREIRLRAVQASMLIAQIAATLDQSGSQDGEDDGKACSTTDEL